jgi:hypothetical protein
MPASQAETKYGSVHHHHKGIQMHCCDFLKLGGLLSAVLFVEFSPLDQLTSRLITAKSRGKLYRRTFDGKFLSRKMLGKPGNSIPSGQSLTVRSSNSKALSIA